MKKKIIKVISVFMVLNILLIPLTNFAPANQIKTVQAAEGVVDPVFFGAILTMLGITSVFVGNMSQNFSIPETDFTSLKNQFAQTLESDAVKKEAFLKAQTEYLAGGIAKTMSAVELSKIGLSDLYNQFLDYCKSKYAKEAIADASGIETSQDFKDYILTQKVYRTSKFPYIYQANYTYDRSGESSEIYTTDDRFQAIDGSGDPAILNILYLVNGYSAGQILYFDSMGELGIQIVYHGGYGIGLALYNKCLAMGIDLTSRWPNIKNDSVNYIGYNSTDNIINTDSDSISVLPTIPWVDSAIPGTIVTPEIALPYAGAVPIDVPLTIPIDPTDPIDPPIEDDPTLIATVAAILAGITPISGILDNILSRELDIADSITAGLTDVIDGLGDITGTLTGGITSSLTDIQSSISTLTAPTTETINLDPVKNIPTVLFSKFPFSIPWDIFNIYNLMATDNRTAPTIKMAIPLSESATLKNFGMSDLNMELNFDNFSRIFEIIRVAELLLFTAGLIYSTKRLVWS